jgi:phage head maturation protease
VKGRVDPASRIRRIHERDLREISIVTFPLLAGSALTA